MFVRLRPVRPGHSVRIISPNADSPTGVGMDDLKSILEDLGQVRDCAS
jgi:hypothetical protein